MTNAQQPSLAPGMIAKTINGDKVRLIKRPQESTGGQWLIRYIDGRVPAHGARYWDQGLFALPVEQVVPINVPSTCHQR